MAKRAEGMTTPDPAPIPAREQAFAAWLRAALLAVIPADGTPILLDTVAGGRIFNRDPVPRGLTTGDVLRGITRLANEGEIEWCGENAKSVRRRVAPAVSATVTDRLVQIRRTIIDPERARLVRRCETLARSLDADMKAYALLSIQLRAAELAEAKAELRGYEAAVRAILGALACGDGDGAEAV